MRGVGGIDVTVERPLLGQWAVVTGGSMGIGRAVADRFVEGGANIVIVARDKRRSTRPSNRSERPPRRSRTSPGSPPTSRPRAGVDGLFEQLQRACLRSISSWPTPERGKSPRSWSRPQRSSTPSWRSTSRAPSTAVQLAGRMMAEHPQPNSAIVIVSSIHALGARPGRLVYAATKAGVNQAVHVAAMELASLRHSRQRIVTGHHGNSADRQEPRNLRRGRRQRPTRARRTARRPRRGGVLPVLTPFELHHGRQPDRRRRGVADLVSKPSSGPS